MKRMRCLMVAVLCVWGCADGDQAAPTAERYDSAGVAVVVNCSEDRALPWTFDRLYSLGGADDGPESFYQIPFNAVATDDESNLYILDGSAHRIVSFTPDGQHRFTVGNEGEGPGELQFPSGLSVSGDGRISVFDFGWISL